MGASVIEQATAEDLLRMPDDGQRHELVRGKVRTMPPAGHEHGRVAMNIGVSLAQFVRAQDLGAVYAAETGFKIASDPDTVRAPDAAFVSEARLKTRGGPAGLLAGRAGPGRGSGIAGRYIRGRARQGKRLARGRHSHGHRGKPPQAHGIGASANHHHPAYRERHARGRRCGAGMVGPGTGGVRVRRAGMQDGGEQDRGREGLAPSPPSEPCGRFSCTRLSSR